jgi:hypothetical protein
MPDLMGFVASDILVSPFRIAPKTLFKTDAAVKGFWLYRDSGRSLRHSNSGTMGS